MALYHLVLKTKDEIVADPDGTEWPSDAAAHAEAEFVAQDLMRHQEMKTRSWRVQVCDEDLRFCSEVLFAAVDQKISHLPAAIRESYITAAREHASWSDAKRELQKTLRAVRETLNHANRLMAVIAGK